MTQLTTLQADRISAPAPTRRSTTTERQSPASLSARDHNNASGEPPAFRLDAPVTHQLYPVEVVYQEVFSPGSRTSVTLSQDLDARFETRSQFFPPEIYAANDAAGQSDNISPTHAGWTPDTDVQGKSFQTPVFGAMTGYIPSNTTTGEKDESAAVGQADVNSSEYGLRDLLPFCHSGPGHNEVALYSQPPTDAADGANRMAHLSASPSHGAQMPVYESMMFLFRDTVLALHDRTPVYAAITHQGVVIGQELYCFLAIREGEQFRISYTMNRLPLSFRKGETQFDMQDLHSLFADRTARSAIWSIGRQEPRDPASQSDEIIRWLSQQGSAVGAGNPQLFLAPQQQILSNLDYLMAYNLPVQQYLFSHSEDLAKHFEDRVEAWYRRILVNLGSFDKRSDRIAYAMAHAMYMYSLAIAERDGVQRTGPFSRLDSTAHEIRMLAAHRAMDELIHDAMFSISSNACAPDHREIANARVFGRQITCLALSHYMLTPKQLANVKGHIRTELLELRGHLRNAVSPYFDFNSMHLGELGAATVSVEEVFRMAKTLRSSKKYSILEPSILKMTDSYVAVWRMEHGVGKSS